MRSLYVWIGVAALVVLLGAGWLGQQVFGQPDGPQGQPPWSPPRPYADNPNGGARQEFIYPPPPNMSGTDRDVMPAAGNVDDRNIPLEPPPGAAMNPPGGVPPVPAPFSAPQVSDLPPVRSPDNFNEAPPSPQTLKQPSFTASASATSAFTPPANVRPGKSESAVTTEWIGPAAAKLGQPMACQILVRNQGTMAVHHVVVRHPIPDGVDVRGSEPAANPSADGPAKLLTWNIGTLEAGQMRKISVQLVSQSRGPLNCYATVTFSNTSLLQVEVREPLLSVKVKGPEKVVTGEEAAFIITLSNPGDGLTDNIELKANLPEGLEHVKGRSLKMGVAPLAPKETRTMKLVCMARGSGPQAMTVAATAEGNLNSSDVVMVDIQQPRLDLVMTGPKLRYIDRHAVYSLKVSNPGNVSASNVTLTEIVPAGFRFHQASGQWQFDKEKHAVTWTVGELMPGQNREISLDLVAIVPGEHRLVGLVNSARGARSEAEVRTRVEGLSKLEVDVVDTEDPVEIGAETTYKICVRNSGTKMESNVQVVCDLPREMEFVRANVRHHVEGRSVVFDPLPSLAPSGADLGGAFYTVTVKGMQPGNLRVRVRVSADSLADPVVREEATRVYNDDAMAP
jgi:uncharacterized repeat protein (TIGR01451 family)